MPSRSPPAAGGSRRAASVPADCPAAAAGAGRRPRRPRPARRLDLGVRRRVGVGDVVGPGRGAECGVDGRRRVVERQHRPVRTGRADRDRGARPGGLQGGLRRPAVGPREQPEAQHDGVAVEQLVGVALGRQGRRRDAAAGDRRVLVEPRGAAVGVHERVDSCTSRRTPAPFVARAMVAEASDRQAVVLRPGGRVAHAVDGRDVREQVDHGLGPLDRAPAAGTPRRTRRPRRHVPRGPRAARGRVERVTPVTSWPAASRWWTVRRPMTPVGPVMTMSLMPN